MLFEVHIHLSCPIYIPYSLGIRVQISKCWFKIRKCPIPTEDLQGESCPRGLLRLPIAALFIFHKFDNNSVKCLPKTPLPRSLSSVQYLLIEKSGFENFFSDLVTILVPTIYYLIEKYSLNWCLQKKIFSHSNYQYLWDIYIGGRFCAVKRPYYGKYL